MFAKIEHGPLMDRVYRHQRHFYDATRKYYLLGRDPMIAGLMPPANGSILEIGCGTGHNLPMLASFGTVDAIEIDPAALIAAHRAARSGGAAVIGHYHSHPTGLAEPSPRDAADAAPDGSIWLIAGGGQVTAWRAVAAGRRHGRFDPLALACAGVTPASQGKNSSKDFA